MSETTCPVFYPTEQEFSDFRCYIEHIEILHPDMSICKIVPPEKWFVRHYDIEKIDLLVKAPIRQITSGRRGIFDIEIYDERDMSLQEFQEIAKELDAKKRNVTDAHELERQFWRTISMCTTFETCPLYGADLPGTLFKKHNIDQSFPQWNLNYLEK